MFRGRRGDLLNIFWHDGVGISLYAKCLERGRFQWPKTSGGAVSISAAQLGYGRKAQPRSKLGSWIEVQEEGPCFGSLAWIKRPTSLVSPTVLHPSGPARNSVHHWHGQPIRSTARTLGGLKCSLTA